jgi:hypothetical protein
MEVFLRPTNDAFLQQVVFPALELGATDKEPAIAHLLRHIRDQETRGLLELVLEHGQSSSFVNLEDERWSEAVYRLLFHEWVSWSDGWATTRQYVGYAGPWEETLHLTLMLEDNDYPYDNEQRAALYRRAFWGQPQRRSGLSSLVCGAWDPLPRFPPGELLTAEGNGQYDLRAGIARADWAWRPMTTVNSWAARLPGSLSRLLGREVKRLHPIDPPERFELIDFWLGRVPQPPVLAVSFSGLGPRTHEWLRELGQLANLVRTAAGQQQGLTAVISRRAPQQLDHFRSDDDHWAR